MTNPDIFSYVKEQESRFDTQEIRVGENWNWSFKEHVQMIFHMKNSQFYTGENDWMRPFKNIMEPILNLAYWSEDIEVKDITFFIENQRGRVLSFLIKKYHDEVYVKEHDIDTLLDEITEDDVDYGGVLVQKGEKRPEVTFLPSLAFCDQTDILGGPLGFKFSFSPDAIRKTSSRGWGDPANGATITLDELIVLAEQKKDSGANDSNETTGKNIEVYIVHGPLPEHFLLDNDNMEDWYNQTQVVGFYTDEKGKKNGVILYRQKQTSELLKFHTSKKVYNRALGRGVGEGLLHPQVWTNFLEIHKTGLLEAAAKVPLVTDDESFTNTNEIQDMENLEVIKVSEGRSISLLNTASPASIQLLERSVNDWFEQAQTTGSAFDPLLGKEANSGTTFRGQERTIQQGRGLHDRRRGQRAKFLEEIYRDWIIPDIVKEIVGGKEFLASLDFREMEWLSDQLAENFANKARKEAALNLETPPDKDALKEQFKENFIQGGNKRLIKILKDEFRGVEVKMGINIAGKQKNLAQLSDKILAIFEFMMNAPQGIPQGMQAAFNDILEFSGVSPADFSEFTALTGQQPQEQPQPQESPLNQLQQPVV